MDRLRYILRQRLEAAQSVQSEHLSTNTLVAFLDQGVHGSERERVLTHLALCPVCRDAVALGAPEAAASNPMSPARSLGSAFQFPAAMRWASLAAALAVAVGVGVLYEHQSAPPNQAVSRTTEGTQQSDSANPLPARESTQGKKVAELPKPASQRPEGPVSRSRVVTEDRELKRKTRGERAVLGKISRSPARVVSTGQNEFQPKAVPSLSETQSKLADRRIPAAPAVSSPTQSMSVPAENPASPETNGDLAADTPNPALAKGTTTTVGAAGAALVGNPGAPALAKALHAVAIGGVAPKSTRANGLVHWTVSAAGKLQRRAADGTLTVVEPRPGATVRAVAAEGIEVWAGGSEPDPSVQDGPSRSVLFHSSDAGETWTDIEGPWQGPITRVNLAGLGSLTVIAADGSWSTGDGGKNWTRK